MKKATLLLFLLLICQVFSQQENITDEFTKRKSYIEVEYFYGNILKHQPSIAPIISGHPDGFILSWNKKTLGNKEWQHQYNFPDYGFSFGYQDYKSEIVGKLYSLYGHYNFYFFNKNNKNQLVLRTGIGLAYNTNPYDKVTNNKNISFGTHLNSSTYFKLFYQRERIVENLGLNAGITFVHASNSNVKSPNTGVNTFGVTLGLNYNIDNETYIYPERIIEKKLKEPLKYNFVFRGGLNESELIGSGIKPFYVLSAYADKRLNRKSSIQVGTDFFISPFLKDFIEYWRINYPEKDSGTSTDSNRIGIFVGHELFLNKLSIITQVGYYVHYPFPYEVRYYERLGIKRYFGDKFYGIVSLKAHAANAETVEFGIGIRL
ncbi:acyloxyacyl hydrolase [Urechidicola croceus]|uniref:Deacylase n=1 Tax=Urechidicola croceus TaxID=1850246 RepID=A0A1D8P7K1_9FLAO|nr:acyloxyacyl hydrolase [Urechidicola croceus]AOW20531.1 deacylase [Urechidicola croceus]